MNFADCSPACQVAGELLIRFGERIGDPRMIQHGQFACRSTKKNLFERHGSWKLFRLFSGLFDPRKALPNPKAPLVRDAYFPDTEIVVAREKEGSVKGLFFAAKGGHNAESHNHNDVGSFVLYSDGKPGLIDIGVETYTQKTFSPERYSLWAMRSGYHNLPTVNGVEESAGRSFSASNLQYSVSKGGTDFSLHLEKAFPEKAGIRSWRRDFRFKRGKKAQLAIREAVDLSGPTRDVFFSLMTVCRQKKSGKGKVILKISGGRDLELTWDESLLTFKSERIAVTDPKLRGEWGPVLWRMVFRLAKTIQKAEISFIFRQI
ncbi:MAG: heparinase II/III family protein [Spirochaetia bacterium]|nr:heparinase II/III family protein [Spirochaetia bacterium]